MNLQNQIQYLKQFHDIDMFDGCTVPEGLNMERVRGAIVMRCGLLTPLYSEPEVQRSATQQFFFENQWNFQHIINILKAEYSPIENVAEWRNETTKNSGADTLTISRNSTETHSGTDTRNVQETGTTVNAESGTTSDAESGSTTTEREVSAENATTYQEDNKETVTHGKTDTTTHGRTDTTTHGKGTTDGLTHGEVIAQGGADTHTTEKGSSTDYEVYRHGNVGITTNTQLITEELALLERFNPYRFIADLYEKELILGLY